MHVLSWDCLKKGFTSLKAGTMHPLSSKDWVQSKVSAACQVPSYKTSPGPRTWLGTALNLLTFSWCSSPEPKAICKHHLVHVPVVHTIVFSDFNTTACNSTIVTQGTHDPNSANPISFIKTALNFSQLKLSCVRVKLMRNHCMERLGSKGDPN